MVALNFIKMKIHHGTKIIGQMVLLLVLISSCRKPDREYEPEYEDSSAQVRVEYQSGLMTLPHLSSFPKKLSQVPIKCTKTIRPES